MNTRAVAEATFAAQGRAAADGERNPNADPYVAEVEALASLGTPR